MPAFFHDAEIKQRHKENCQQGAAYHTAEYASTNGVLRFSTGITGNHQRHHAQYEGKRGHQDLVQTHPCGFKRRFCQTFPILMQPSGKLHNHNGILAEKPIWYVFPP